tara:strand:+ start:4746 stop:6092 length:1347 start_codon:yes stop_codon:yes gene_type:complete
MSYTDVDSFKSFGTNFQNCVLQAALIDRDFFEKSFEVLKEEYFTSEAHKTVWLEIRKLFNKYSAPPTYDTLKTEISQYPEGELKESTINVLLDIETKVNRQEIEYAKDKSLEFCRNQSMKGAILQSVDLLKEGKFEEIQKTIEDSLRISTEQDMGHDYFDSFKSRQQVHTRSCIPTGFPLLDQSSVLDGGLAHGELGVVMAPTGGGKSFMLVNFGYGALAAGKNVVHYTFELSETHVGNRYDSRITSIPTKELRSRMSEAEGQLANFNGGQLFIKEYPPKVATINTIKFHMGRLLSNGFSPDLIIIDYGDLMKSRRGYDQKRFELESIFEDLRALSMEMKLPIWTATQSNRDGFNDDVITIDKVGEAINKAMVVDFFGTFSQRKFHVGKNRMGQANINFNIEMDPARSFIDLNEDMPSTGGFSINEKVNNMLNGGDKMRSLYRDFKEG